VSPKPVESIARHAEDKRALLARLLQTGAPQRPAVKRRVAAFEAPLSFGQQRLWFFEQLMPGASVYNMMIPLRLGFAVSAAALLDAINEVIARHEAVRTTFRAIDGRPTQFIAPELEIEMPLYDLRGLAHEEQQAETARIFATGSQAPYDLTSGPLLRAHLLQYGNEDHLLMISMHHIISDAWSATILMEELDALYSAFSQGQPSPLAPLSVQYPDFAVWQREWLSGEVLDRQLDYWKTQLDGIVSIDLPCDYPRAASAAFDGKYVPIGAGPALLMRLRALSASQDCTLFMTLLAAFQVYLFRHTGQTDVVVGTPVANRNHADVEKLIGFFINSLAMRTNLEGNPTFREVLSRVRETALGAYAHMDIPFEMLVEHLQPERDFTRNPIFQVLFQVQTMASNRELDAPPGGQLHNAVFDLNVNLYEQPAALVGRFEYSAALFDELTVQRMASRFVTLLESIVDNPDLRISDLQIIPQPEWSQLELSNPAAMGIPSVHKTIHEWFERQACATPDAPALSAGGSSMTYTELNRRADDVAQRLRELGVTSGDRVAIRLPRSAEAIVAILGALKAGAAYVPLDPDYPADRLRFMLEDCGARVLVTPDGVRLQRASADPAPLDTAYIIYTSGSTGTPKGVCVPHSCLIYSVWARLQYYAEPVERFLLLSPLSFDSSVAGIFWTLCSGGCLDIPTREEMEDIPELAFGIERRNITHLLAVPSLYARLLDWFDVSALCLKTAIVAGEPCPPALVRYHFERLPKVALYNEYGPTEATVWSTVYRCGPEEAAIVPIGRGIPHTRIYIVDRFGHLVPFGVPGEVWIGGPGVAHGYWNRPDLTAERFIRDPFSDSESPLYRTGDLGKHRNDGNIVFLGRIDNQVKVRGYRIELGEIESALLAHPAVAECAAFTWKFEDDTRLAACATAAGERVPSDDLAAFLRRSLPAYMVPSSITWMDALPRNANGKLDRAVLAANPERFDTETFVAPRTSVEKAVSGLYQEVLGIPDPGIHSDFFRLGGHSLLATRLLSRVNKTFQIDLLLPSLFRAATIAKLATEIERVLVDEVSGPDELQAGRIAEEGIR
jgi:amino acid adenylation domain-containing protein